MCHLPEPDISATPVAVVSIPAMTWVSRPQEWHFCEALWPKSEMRGPAGYWPITLPMLSRTIPISVASASLIMHGAMFARTSAGHWDGCAVFNVGHQQ